MKTLGTITLTLALIMQPLAVAAQSCPVEVAGESMARMIGEAGGAHRLREMALAQVAEYDRWLSDLEGSRGQGIAEAQIEALRAEGLQGRAANQQIAEAALCYMG